MEIHTSKDDTNTFLAVFTEDILPVIFDNLEILTGKDLLNFRLVNRCWRDAATSVILKRNTCPLALNFGKVVLTEDGNSAGEVEPLMFHRHRENNTKYCNTVPTAYFNANKPTSFLSDLCQLISTSPKFPFNSIHLHSGCTAGFGNLSPPSEFVYAPAQPQTHLFQFFSLYGNQIKKISLCRGISIQAIQNLLLVHLPHLICLDLEDFDFEQRFLFPGTGQDQDPQEVEGQIQILPPSSKLEIKEILLGNLFHNNYSSRIPKDKYNLVKELLRVSPNLCSIKSVDVSSLGLLLEMGKCHFIKDLEFNPKFIYMAAVQQFTKLVAETTHLLSVPEPGPKLSKLTVQNRKIRGDNSNTYDIVKYLNIILSANKDSLKYLEVYVNPSDIPVNIFIPPLPHLKKLKLDDLSCRNPSSFLTRFHFLGDVIGGAVQDGEIIADQADDGFQSLNLMQQDQMDHTIPPDYFPLLKELNLHMRILKNFPANLLDFFSLDHLGPDGVTSIPGTGDTFLTVTSLELHTDTLPQFCSYMSKLFPNVTQLKIHCTSTSCLRNWIWTEFPNLEIFEIFVQKNSWDVKVIDSFFTGFSHELCSKLERKATWPHSESMERVLPYIGDCENLKELKINFTQKMNWKFASKVTAAYGFHEVFHRTNIIISFETVDLSAEEIQATRKDLNPVAPYVEIRLK